MADSTSTSPASAVMRISDQDWNDMADRRDRLDEDIDKAFQRRSVRMAAIAIDERAGLSAQLKKAHNMREREKLASYRKRLDDLKVELGQELADVNGTASQQGAA